MRTLIGQAELERRIAEIAAEIDRDYLGGLGGLGNLGGPGTAGAASPEGRERLRQLEEEPLICIGVLKGAVFFLVDLLKRLTLPVAVDFLQTSSYGARGAARGEVRIVKDVDLPLHGRDVLLVEDIVDTGHTLRTLLDLLDCRGPRSLRLCALLDKSAARKVPVHIDYRGFVIENAFVVGYGLDYKERYRNLPYIAIVET